MGSPRKLVFVGRAELPSTLMSLERSRRTQSVYEGCEREHVSPYSLLPENTTFWAQKRTNWPLFLFFFRKNLVNPQKSSNFTARYVISITRRSGIISVASGAKNGILTLIFGRKTVLWACFWGKNAEKCTFFEFFCQIIWSIQKKAVPLHPLSGNERWNPQKCGSLVQIERKHAFAVQRSQDSRLFRRKRRK